MIFDHAKNEKFVVMFIFEFEFYKRGSLNTLLLSIYNVTCTITPLALHNKHKINKCMMEYKEHLRSDASD